MISKAIRNFPELAKELLKNENFFLNISEAKGFKFSSKWNQIKADFPNINTVYTLMPNDTDFETARQADIVFNVSRKKADIEKYHAERLPLCPCDDKTIPSKNACSNCGRCWTQGGIKKFPFDKKKAAQLWLATNKEKEKKARKKTERLANAKVKTQNGISKPKRKTTIDKETFNVLTCFRNSLRDNKEPKSVVASNGKTGLSILDNLPVITCAATCPIASKCYDIKLTSLRPIVGKARAERHALILKNPDRYVQKTLQELNKTDAKNIRIYSGGDFHPRHVSIIKKILNSFLKR
tara:strand:- start:8 stop:892 length:885 start_codon:yes stop_codon:yes gene_type:complete